MSNYTIVLIVIGLMIGSAIWLIVWSSKQADRRKNLPKAEEVKKLKTLVNDAEAIFGIMTNPSSLENFDILTEETKQLIDNWQKTHRKLDA